MNTQQIREQMIRFLQAQILKLDSQAFAPLTHHHHKHLMIHIEGLFDLCFRMDESQLSLVDPLSAQNPNTQFSGPLSAYVQGLFSKHPQAGQLQIQGDLELAQDFFRAWHQIDLDWEGYFSQHLGDPIAYLLGEIGRRSAQWLQQTVQDRYPDIKAYLQDEIEYLPPQQAVTDWYHAVDTIRHDVDRIEARLMRLRGER